MRLMSPSVSAAHLFSSSSRSMLTLLHWTPRKKSTFGAESEDEKDQTMGWYEYSFHSRQHLRMVRIDAGGRNDRQRHMLDLSTRCAGGTLAGNDQKSAGRLR